MFVPEEGQTLETCFQKSDKKYRGGQRSPGPGPNVRGVAFFLYFLYLYENNPCVMLNTDLPYKNAARLWKKKTKKVKESPRTCGEIHAPVRSALRGSGILAAGSVASDQPRGRSSVVGLLSFVVDWRRRVNGLIPRRL